MPWFPDFTSAVELARRQTRDTALADPAAEYLHALNDGKVHDLETAWPGEIVVYDPRAGEIRSHHQLRQFIGDNHAWFAAHEARIETVASTSANGRAVLELVAHLTGDDGQPIAWPVAVVAESAHELSISFRTYCSQYPVDPRRPVRPAILPSGADRPGDIVGRYLAAQEIGDTETIVNTFAPDGYYREPIGTRLVHRGAAELRSFFTERLGTTGIGVQECAVTDDGMRCAVEYNCIRWGDHALSPQAGLTIFERGPDGLLAAARGYDDIQPPGGHG
jgi:hypothetical protein